jgi:uncharacterized protein YkwD
MCARGNSGVVALVAAAVVAVAIVAASVTAPAAWGGSPIAMPSGCPNSYLIFAPGEGNPVSFRAALVCLINAARGAEHLPALQRSGQLERVAQRQSDRFARIGRSSHGSSPAAIGRRLAAAGYRASEVAEAFAVLGSGSTPYGFLYEMLRRSGGACSEIFGPHFRDIGIGANAIPMFDTLALELGLRAGRRPPSTDGAPAGSCPHAVAKPVVTNVPPIQPGTAPVATADAVSLGVRCEAQAACVFTGTLKLPDVGASAPLQGTVTVPAGGSTTISFMFATAQIAAELAVPSPKVALSIVVTEPAQYTSTLTGPLTPLVAEVTNPLSWRAPA